MARLNREETKRRTREHLLASARQIFAKRGFAGASVDEIAEHAGYSKGAVYSNFESKEALFLELLRDRMADEIADLQQALKESRSFQEVLAALKMRYSTLETQVTWCLLSSEFQLQAGRNPEFADAFADLYRNQRKAVAKLVTLVAEKAGAKPTWSADKIATSLMALTHGIALQRAADPKSVRADTAGQALQLFLGAVLGSAEGEIRPSAGRGKESARKETKRDAAKAGSSIAN